MDDQLFFIHYIKVKSMGIIRLEISANIPEPICLRIKLTFDLLLLDLITEHHFFLLFFIFPRTVSKSFLFVDKPTTLMCYNQEQPRPY